MNERQRRLRRWWCRREQKFEVWNNTKDWMLARALIYAHCTVHTNTFVGTPSSEHWKHYALRAQHEKKEREREAQRATYKTVTHEHQSTIYFFPVLYTQKCLDVIFIIIKWTQYNLNSKCFVSIGWPNRIYPSAVYGAIFQQNQMLIDHFTLVELDFLLFLDWHTNFGELLGSCSLFFSPLALSLSHSPPNARNLYRLIQTHQESVAHTYEHIRI